jgi:predicted outer membrane repeat protein
MTIFFVRKQPARFVPLATVLSSSLCAALTLAAAPARAATVTVNTTTPNSSTDNKCGLVEAVQAINQASTYRSCTYTANGQSDKIIFSVSGTHAVATSLTLTRNVEITGLGQSSTIVTSTGNCTFCSFGSASGATHVVGLRSMTIQKASASSNTIGIMVLPSSAVRLYTDSVRVTGFTAYGIYGYESNVTLQINASTIDSNASGIYLGGGFLQLTSSTVRNNTQGGINIYQWDSPVHYSYISGSTIRDNTASNGAGVKVDVDEFVDDSTTPALDISNSTISGNNATGYGGGLFAKAFVRVATTLFDNNSAAQIGGGFVAYERSTGYPIHIENSAFKNNRATHGAGFSNYGPFDGQLIKVSLFHSTFASNVATGDGGGIYSLSQIDTAENLTLHGNQAARGGGLFHQSGGESHLFHCTITGNRATQSSGGGGLWIETGNPLYRFNIIAENRAGAGSTPPLNNVVTTAPSLNAEYNLLDDVTGVTAIFPTSSSGGTNLVGNPQLGALGYNGGFGDTRPLLASSPALDHIPPDQDDTEFDQRGIIRPVDGNFNGIASPDIGALEMNSTFAMYEGESQTVAAQSNETLTTESNAAYSAGIGRVKQANLNGYVTLQTPALQPGTYGVIVWFKKASNAGRFRLAVGTSASSTTNLGGETDGYRSTAQWTKVNLGTITVSSAGARYFKFTATSKNGSSSGYWMFIDAIQLYKTN